MSASQLSHKRYVSRWRAVLFAFLGEACAECGADKDLAFDVVVPFGTPKWHHGRMSQRQRVNFYREQCYAGNLQVLCDQCNTAKARHDGTMGHSILTARQYRW